MKIGQRIDVIKKVCGALDQSEIADSNLILRTFGCRTWNDFDTSSYEYYVSRVEDLNNENLIELYEYLYPGESIPSGSIIHKSSLWKEGFVKAFISHSTKQKLLAAQIKNEAASYGIDCFVAHEDIEASKEWMREIRYALATCDCIVALLTKDFQASNYCDQEIGFALQRGVLVIPISIEIDPYGFMGPFQRVTAFEKSPSDMVQDIQRLIDHHDSLSEVAKAGIMASQSELIKTFLSSSNFGDSSALLKKIETLPSIQKPDLELLASGWEKMIKSMDALEFPHE